MNIVFSGLAKNCLNNVKKNIEFVDKFKEYYPKANIYFFILESDSTDGSKEYLSNINKEYLKIFNLDELEKKIIIRTERIAFCRNFLLKKIKEEANFSNFLYIPLDLDIELFKYTSNEEFKNLLIMLKNNKSYDVIFPFSFPYYYDIHALRSNRWNTKNPWHSINSINKYLPIGKFFTRYFFIYRKQKKYNKKLTEIKVESAFGGIGIYKVNKDLFKNLEYSIDLKFGNTSCEHIKFNSFFKNKIIYPLWIIPSPLEHIEFKLISFNNKIKYIFKTIIGDIKNII